MCESYRLLEKVKCLAQKKRDINQSGVNVALGSLNDSLVSESTHSIY